MFALSKVRPWQRLCAPLHLNASATSRAQSENHTTRPNSQLGTCKKLAFHQASASATAQSGKGRPPKPALLRSDQRSIKKARFRASPASTSLSPNLVSSDLGVMETSSPEVAAALGPSYPVDLLRARCRASPICRTVRVDSVAVQPGAALPTCWLPARQLDD